MAKRAQRAANQGAASVDATVESGAAGASAAHFVVFRIADDAFAFRLDAVGEILRMPNLAHMPLGPRSLLGLANLHGAVLPVVGVRRVLGFPDAPLDDAVRVIVVDQGAPVAFAVDRIENLVSLPTDRIENGDAGAGGIDAALLVGIIKGAEGEGSVKILSPQRLLRDFGQLGVAGSRSAAITSVAVATSAKSAAVPEKKISLISFDLGAQEYALPLDRVREIIQLPAHVSEVPRAETAVLGVVTLRDRLLPLVSLRALLGLPLDHDRAEAGKVLVLSIGKGAIGVVADRTREILRIDENIIDPAPALLTRGAGDAEITSICRLDHGKRLVAVLSPDRLFRSEVVSRLLSEQNRESDAFDNQADGGAMADEQFVIFRLGEQEYGLPIAAVDEIARPPDQIARLPKAPSFVDGVMNLRGTVVPIIDLRRRFDVASKEPVGGRRILVLALGGGKTGFMVDAVSEVLRVPTTAIRPAPDTSPEQMRLISRVANLDAQSRMILLVDPAQLLDQIEADVLNKFDRANPEQVSKAS
jgi:purine-binding chemotaxis protein CheW